MEGVQNRRRACMCLSGTCSSKTTECKLSLDAGAKLAQIATKMQEEIDTGKRIYPSTAEMLVENELFTMESARFGREVSKVNAAQDSYGEEN